ncbi:hypothetical protein MYE70_00620 [Marinobacter alexandrii]|uniref:hypothetical protein n=1 Tax=Marinobacter alexandrii TaxID=2570351 RepID=UPI001FFF4D5B|nr:hypothetical protein [Marinobacter alexandrii]MCK2147560.1 hypothetical protein [Marinobacter alexandrii]
MTNLKDHTETLRTLACHFKELAEEWSNSRFEYIKVNPNHRRPDPVLKLNAQCRDQASRLIQCIEDLTRCSIPKVNKHLEELIEGPLFDESHYREALDAISNQKRLEPYVEQMLSLFEQQMDQVKIFRETIESTAIPLKKNLKPLEQILTAIHDCCADFCERRFGSSSEEDLSGHISGHLSHSTSMLKATVTLESVNGAGKTDLKVSFPRGQPLIAECKIWNGSKKCAEAIDQLLNYLTPKGEEGALILFVRQNPAKAEGRSPDLAEVREKAQETMRSHKCYDEVGPDEGSQWQTYKFRDSKDRSIHHNIRLMVYSVFSKRSS